MPLFSALKELFVPAPGDGRAVYAWALTWARHAFAGRFAADKTAEDDKTARFEAIALPMTVALWLLKASPAHAEVAQRAHDAMFDDFDAALREYGVGDLSVGKHVKKYAAAFYGRLTAYTPAYDTADAAALAEALVRNKAARADEAPAVADAVLALVADAKAQGPAAWLAKVEGAYQ
jgi:cytochrome b pre-mRNA-processing protein 3